MEVLFKPAENQLSPGSSKRHISPATVAAAAATADASRAGGGDTMEGVFGGALAIRRRWESEPKKDESKAFSCMLWCTIALGAMTSNLNIRTVSLVAWLGVFKRFCLPIDPGSRTQ